MTRHAPKACPRATTATAARHSSETKVGGVVPALTLSRIIFPKRYFFEKEELKIILDLYAKMVSHGSWKDYGLTISSKQVGFNIFKNAAEKEMYKICKNFKPKNKNLKYLITESKGKI